MSQSQKQSLERAAKIAGRVLGETGRLQAFMEKKAALELARTKIRNCLGCDLVTTCRAPVPGRGPEDAPICVVAEAPGAEEDRYGLPLIGASGMIITQAFLEAGFNPQNAYFTNVVHCRPPENRTPTSDEVQTCFPHAQAELEAIRPKVILTLGRTAFAYFVPDEPSLGKARGRIYETPWGPLVPTWHPSNSLRRDTQKKREIFEGIVEDIKRALKLLEE